MYQKNSGVNHLAQVLTQRMRQEIPTDLILDFGQINGDLSLTTNTFPVKIPPGDYVVCMSSKLSAGSRVLVAWVQSEAVVIDCIGSIQAYRLSGGEL